MPPVGWRQKATIASTMIKHIFVLPKIKPPCFSCLLLLALRDYLQILNDHKMVDSFVRYKSLVWEALKINNVVLWAMVVEKLSEPSLWHQKTGFESSSINCQLYKGKTDVEKRGIGHLENKVVCAILWVDIRRCFLRHLSITLPKD